MNINKSRLYSMPLISSINEIHAPRDGKAATLQPNASPHSNTTNTDPVPRDKLPTAIARGVTIKRSNEG